MRLPDAAFAALLAGTPLARAARRCYSARADERALCADGRRAARQRNPRAATGPSVSCRVCSGARALCAQTCCACYKCQSRCRQTGDEGGTVCRCWAAAPAAPGGSASFPVLRVTRSAPVCVRTGAPTSGRTGSLVLWETSIVWPALLALALCGCMTQSCPAYNAPSGTTNMRITSLHERCA